MALQGWLPQNSEKEIISNTSQAIQYEHSPEYQLPGAIKT